MGIVGNAHAVTNYFPICCFRLIGLSSQPNKFDSSVLQKMGKLNDKPIIFPLSNPASQAECNFEDAMKYTNNKVLFASGTAFPPYKIPKTNETKVPGQGNNGKD
jgi:malic enzyme